MTPTLCNAQWDYTLRFLPPRKNFSGRYCFWLHLFCLCLRALYQERLDGSQPNFHARWRGGLGWTLLKMGVILATSSFRIMLSLNHATKWRPFNFFVLEICMLTSTQMLCNCLSTVPFAYNFISVIIMVIRPSPVFPYKFIFCGYNFLTKSLYLELFRR